MLNKTQTVYIAKSIYQALLEAPNGTPSGHLYAALLGKLSMDEYITCIAVLKEAGLVTESNYVLTAIKSENIA